MILDKIKLIIWDMDNTFYEGNLEQNTVVIPDNRKDMINNLIDIGIQNSICSKNNYDKLKELLLKAGLWDSFIFPVINFKNKKENIQIIIDSIHIQPQNILFIDDNFYNREEARYYIPELNVEGTEIIPLIIKEACVMEKRDIEHRCLKNYKMLEKPIFDRINYSSNWEFLRQSKISVAIHKDCMLEIDRIYELGQKANQLNFTKRRLNKETLLSLFGDKTIEKAYITVNDKYGDYGIVGFYTMKDGTLYDFYFSCRILGMYVEQYIYGLLGYPKISISGNTAVSLNKKWLPDWFYGYEVNNTEEQTIEKFKPAKILLRGECEMKQIINYIQNNEVYGEFDRESMDGNPNHIYNMHTETLVQSIINNKTKLKSIVDTTLNYDKDTFNFNILNKHYDVILFGFSSDIRQGMYKNKASGDIIIAGDNLYPIIKKNNLHDISKKSRIKFTQQSLEDFIDTYEYIGSITKERFIDNLKIIRNVVSLETKFVFIKYVPFKMKNNMIDRSKQIVIINEALNEFCENKNNNSYILDLNNIIRDISDYDSDNLHFKRIIYYYIAAEFSKILTNMNYERLKMPEYHLPYVSDLRQLALYKLFDLTSFVIIGLCKESMILGKVLRKKCYAIVDVENRINKEIEELKLLNFNDFIKIKDKNYLLIHKPIKDNANIVEYINKRNYKEFEDFEYFS